MKTNESPEQIALPEELVRQIRNFAEARGMEKVILFGSRARGTQRERSDIDLAVLGGDFLGFFFDVQEEADTLLQFDLVNLSENVTEALKNEITQDGVLLYENHKKI